MISVDNLTVEFGGHAQAAGVSILKDKFDEFENALNEYLLQNCKFEDFIQATEIEELIEDKFPLQFYRKYIYKLFRATSLHQRQQSFHTLHQRLFHPLNL